MGNAKLHRIPRFRMGSHHLPIEEGRHFNLPQASRFCNLCNTGALDDEGHMLLECPALADCLRTDVTLPHPDKIPSDQPCWLPGMSKYSFLWHRQ